MSQQKPYVSTSFSYETLEETLDIKPKGARLHIGIPKEIAFQENRIALTPDAVSVLISNGHEVTIENNAGEAAHFADKDFCGHYMNLIPIAIRTNYTNYFLSVPHILEDSCYGLCHFKIG